MQGVGYRLAENAWKDIIPIFDTAINYCEIGVLCGHNIISFCKNFAKHPESKLYAIDPWLSYTDCPDEHYVNHNNNYNYYLYNINMTGVSDKIITKRGFSEDILPTFDNLFFDIIFIDGNHQEPYYEKDFLLSIPILKNGGYIIIDDTNHPPIYKKAEEIFELIFKDQFTVIQKNNEQFIYKKNSI